MRNNILTAVKPLALCVCAFAPWVSAYADDPETEVGTEQQLNEVIVEADDRRIIDEGMEYTPSRRVKEASFDVYSMIDLLQMNDVIYDQKSKVLKTFGDKPYTVYINGVEADK